MSTLALIVTGILPIASLHAAERPNILFFFVDDMGITDTSIPFLVDSDAHPVKNTAERALPDPEHGAEGTAGSPHFS